MGNQSKRNKLEDLIQKNLLTLLFAFLLFGVVVACVILFFYFGNFSGAFSNRQDVWGQFGDFVGGSLNPLFAFLSFIALLMTLLIQNKELMISSDELKKSTEALTQQSKALDLQNFERTFFELVRLHHELVNGIFKHELESRVQSGQIGFERVRYEGRECFERFYSGLKNAFEEVSVDQAIEEQIEQGYTNFFNLQSSSIDHYFRNLYHIFKFIDESCLDNKQRYASIVRTQLSRYELFLLFYNALIPRNYKFKVLIEQYAIFEIMDLNILLNKSLHVPLYQGTAYGDQAPISYERSA